MVTSCIMQLSIDGDFLYFLVDAAVMAFQYWNPEALCSPLVQAKKDGGDLVDAYASYIKGSGIGVETYSQKHLKKTSPGENSSDRLWWFQVCTEVAYFQVAPANDSVRSSKVDSRHVSVSVTFSFLFLCTVGLINIFPPWIMIRYHLDLCRNVFGDGVYSEVDATNLYYGGTKIAGSKIVFTNGSQDPWRHASKQASSSEMPSYLMSCHNCGHRTDLRGCPQSPLNPEGNDKDCSSPDAVNKVRQQITDLMDLWLSECTDAERDWSAI
ncbi:putative serine protease EDA2 [Drosera capensis]